MASNRMRFDVVSLLVVLLMGGAVALFIPVVLRIAAETRLNASRLLMAGEVRL